MANAIDTGNPVPGTQFIVNKYDDIDGVGLNQETPRGRLAFRDTNGRMTLPRTLEEAQKAVFPVDWFKPLNPGPYFDGVGLNGLQVYAINDGSLNEQESAFAMDPDTLYNSAWPTAIKQYDIPKLFYNLPVPSGSAALAYDEGTVTYGSGNYTGVSSDFNYGSFVYADYATGNEGKPTVSGAVAGNKVVGHVVGKDIFGQNTITIKLRGAAALG
jgi:hypothetical protein